MRRPETYPLLPVSLDVLRRMQFRAIGYLLQARRREAELIAKIDRWFSEAGL